MVSSQRDQPAFKGTPLAKNPEQSMTELGFNMDSGQIDRQMNPVYTPSLVSDHPSHSHA